MQMFLWTITASLVERVAFHRKEALFVLLVDLVCMLITASICASHVLEAHTILCQSRTVALSATRQVNIRQDVQSTVQSVLWVHVM